MNAPRLRPGDCSQLVRRLGPHVPDPIDLYSALSDGGARNDSLLFESGEQGARSIIMTRCALRARCHGREVQVDALNANGQGSLPWLAEAIRGAASLRVEHGGLRVTFPPVPEGDDETRLRAPSPVEVLRCLSMRWNVVAGEQAFGPMVAGAFAYDFVGAFEQLPAPRAPGLSWPDYEFWLPDELIRLDHDRRSATAVHLVFGGDRSDEVYHDAAARMSEVAKAYMALPEAPERPVAVARRQVSGSFVPDMDDDAFAAAVTQLKSHIRNGDVIQIVGSRTFRGPCSDPLEAYRRLRAINPSPYMFFVRSDYGVLLGASPETALRVDGPSRRIEVRPIAGTRPRGRRDDGSVDRDLDDRLEAELRLSAKENAEHMMLVDLARNDVARVSRTGTRGMDRLLGVDRYSHVMHLVSCVSGELRPELDALDAYVATMNMGTLVGAPKVKAAQLLRQVESTRRGPYGGAVGYVTQDGSLDSCITIRSAVVVKGIAHVRAGAGIVYDSDPAAEAQETRQKAAAVLQAMTPPQAEAP